MGISAAYEFLDDAFEEAAERYLMTAEEWLQGNTDEDELSELREGLRYDLGLEPRTAQRYVKFMTGEPGQKRQPSPDALAYMRRMAPPGELRMPAYARVEVSAYICVSDDCRNRVVKIPMHGAAARRFARDMDVYGPEEGLRYLFPPEDEDGAPMGIPGATLYPRTDGEENYFIVTTTYD